MKITERALSGIKPYSNNPRNIPEAAVVKVARSIKEFGFRQPLVVDVDGVIIVGHTRYLAAKTLGIKRVPVHVMDATDEHVRAYRIADNRLGEISNWDDAALVEELESLDGMLDTTLTGFDMGELQAMLSPTEDAAPDGEDSADECTDPPADPITMAGDMWLLGDHRLFCGDSTDDASAGRLMGGDEASLLFTSPPYGNQRDYTSGGVGDWDALMNGALCAQGDLLRFIDDKLAPSHQVIYSTHSPFMVPADKLQRVRIVEDKVDETKRPRKSYGTKVSQDVLSVNADTLFPLQGALGYEATQTLFVGEHTLLVEGPSDILYLHALSTALNARKRTALDSRWTLCPAGGIDSIMPFVSLFAGKGLHIAVLSDQAQGAKGKVDRIRRSDILQAGHFFTVAEFIDQAEGDIEDIFDAEVYAEIVNRSYALPESHRVTVEKLCQETSTTRLVKKVEAMFKLMPNSIPMFDHYTPAAWLIRNPDLLDGESEAIEQTLSVAERMFQTYNGLLD